MTEPSATVPQYDDAYQQQMNQYYSSYFGAGKTPDQTMLSDWYNTQYQAPITGFQKPQQAPQASTTPSTPSGAIGGSGGNYNFAGVSTGGSNAPGGQGVNQTTVSAALGMMAASENPTLRAMRPIAAALIGILGGQIADGQINGMSAADAKLAASKALSEMGIGTVADEDGNIRTISTPATIAAADEGMFGGIGDASSGSYGSDGSASGFGGIGASTGGWGGYGGAYGGGIGDGY